MGRGLIPGTIWKISCHNLFITYFYIDLFQALTFILQKQIFELTNCENKSLRELPCSTCKYFFSSLVSKIYQTMSICIMMLETVCKIYPRR
jgi:hypothetical protein